MGVMVLSSYATSFAFFDGVVRSSKFCVCVVGLYDM